MHIRQLSTEQDFRRYDEWILTHPEGNLWQSLAWKKYQKALGREVRIYADAEWQATALVVIDRTVGGYSTWEIPRGPLGNDESVHLLLKCIIDDAKKDRCIALHLSPCLALHVQGLKLKASHRHVQPEATRILDLTKNEEEILAQMQPKGRYNIGVARKHKVTVTNGSVNEIDAFYALLTGTSARDGFKASQKSHYVRFLSSLDDSFILMANHDGKPIAGLIGAVWPPPLTPPPSSAEQSGEGNFHRIGIYYYGASSYEHRHLMAPYLLQWEAIQHCKHAGCKNYDLLGIAPERQATNQSLRSDSWQGITDFKRKFGGTVVTYPPEQTIVLRPMVKAILDVKRKILG